MSVGVAYGTGAGSGSEEERPLGGVIEREIERHLREKLISV